MISNNKRIIKNTLLLYFRMFLTMGVSLYTSRVVLDILGVVDYGIYNIVGGIVIMFSFLNNAMAIGTQRFLSFEIGRTDFRKLANVFSTAVNIHITIAVVILLFAELIGVWFLNAKIVFPIDRVFAVNFVYQLSVLTFITSILSVPYNASIIAHERMGVFAWVSIIEVSLKLVLVVSLTFFEYDKLVLYSLFLFFVSLVLRGIYGFYCTRKFQECKYKFEWNRELYISMLKYNGWNLWGNFAAISYNQGINILLNLFFGPTVNAARAIAYQVYSSVNGFVGNLQMAINPQIVKTFAADKLDEMHHLIYQGAKFSFFLLALICVPLILDMSFVLGIWLKNVPDYAIVFCQLVLVSGLVDSLSGSIGTAALASGRMKKYQIVVGTLQILILPISYFFLKRGYSPETTFYIIIIFSVITLFARLVLICPLVRLKVRDFISKVIIRVMLVSSFSIPFPLYIRTTMEVSFLRLCLIVVSSSFSIVIFGYLFGLEKSEKALIGSRICKLIR